MKISRVASISRSVAILAALLFIAGPLAIQLGALAPDTGFRVFMLGCLTGVIALLLGLLGLFLTRPATSTEGRGAAVTGAAVGGVILAIVLVTAGPTASVPPINDITTNPANPPAFDRIRILKANASRDMSYPEEFAEAQRAGYADLAPIPMPGLTPKAVLDRVEAAASDFGWEFVGRNDANGTFEASETTRIFRFVDDIIVRAEPFRGGSIVDVRSKSRDGRSDLGANAARIQRLVQAIRP